MTQLVAFDLDGTIVDSRAAIVGCFQDAIAQHRAGSVPDAAIVANIGRPLREMLEGLVDPDVMIPVLQTYSGQFAEWDRKHTLMFPGMVDTFHELRSTGRSLVVTSSKSVRGIERVLREQGIDHLFDAIWGGDSVENGKPHPEMLLRAMASAGAEASDTVIVGDTTYDIEMGVAAGVPAVGVAWGMHGAARLTAVGAACVVAHAHELTSAVVARPSRGGR